VSTCALCAVILTGEGELCTHHHTVKHDDWAAGNRVMCDFLHRKRIPPPPVEDESICVEAGAALEVAQAI
jgi:hypothetical protein